MFLIPLLLTFAIPSWSAARPVTVDQLHLMLADMQRANKTDQEVTTELHQVMLTQELTGAAPQSITPLLPGPLATVWPKANATAKINFLRWETVNGKPAADVVPNGDSFAARYTLRHILLTSEFKDYAEAK